MTLAAHHRVNSRKACMDAANLEPRHNEEPRHWCADVAMCGCEGVVDICQVPCIPIARGMHRDGLYDRCLLCGKCWTARDYREDKSRLISDPGESLCMPYGYPGFPTERIMPLFLLGMDVKQIIAETGIPYRRVHRVLSNIRKGKFRSRRRSAA